MKIVSDWKFETSSTGGVGFALFSISGGMIRITKTDENNVTTDTVDLSYRGAGVGASLGPKGLKNAPLPQGLFAPTDFLSAGIVFKMPACKNADLEISDFLGSCMYVDASAGSMVAGASGTILFLGLPQQVLLPLAAHLALAKAVIPMIGFTLCMQPHAGITASAGVMYKSGAYPSIPFA